MSERDAPQGPAISVVVPVRNQRTLLGRLLDALATQTLTDFEVIVVDDGSTDGSDQLVKERAGADTRLRLIQSPGVGAVAARQTGVAAATAPLLAFTDSDCAPVPGWLDAGTAALRNGADVVSGVTRPVGPVGLLDRSLASGEEGLYPTSNVFYRRAAFDAADGFDHGAAGRLGFRWWRRAQGLGFGEDTLLAWRVRRAGRAAFAPDAVVLHHVFPPDLADTLSRTLQMGSFPGLVREVPELREQPLLRRRVFLGDGSRTPLYAAAVAVAAGRRRPAAAALGAWTLVRLWHAHRAGVPLSDAVRSLPARLLVDATAAGALVAGSVRSGTLVL